MSRRTARILRLAACAVLASAALTAAVGWVLRAAMDRRALRQAEAPGLARAARLVTAYESNLDKLSNSLLQLTYADAGVKRALDGYRDDYEHNILLYTRLVVRLLAMEPDFEDSYLYFRGGETVLTWSAGFIDRRRFLSEFVDAASLQELEESAGFLDISVVQGPAALRGVTCLRLACKVPPGSRDPQCLLIGIVRADRYLGQSVEAGFQGTTVLLDAAWQPLSREGGSKAPAIRSAHELIDGRAVTVAEFPRLGLRFATAAPLRWDEWSRRTWILAVVLTALLSASAASAGVAAAARRMPADAAGPRASKRRGEAASAAADPAPAAPAALPGPPAEPPILRLEYPYALERKLLNLVGAGKTEEAEQCLDAMIDVLAHHAPGDRREMRVFVLQVTGALDRLIYGGSHGEHVSLMAAEPVAGREPADVVEVRRLCRRGLEAAVAALASARDGAPDAEALVRYLEQTFTQGVQLWELGERFGMDSDAVGRLLKKRTGMSFNEYVNGLKVTMAKDLLRGSDLAVAEISVKVGFAYPHYFIKVFKKMEGVTPGEYRDAARARAGRGS